jgi:hypothetical protein
MDHRLMGYKVDPGGKLREALAGADTVPQLEHAWSFLTNWLFKGGKRVDKYYREDRMEIVNSLRSTDPGFFDEGFLSGTVEDTLSKHLMHPHQLKEQGLPDRPPLGELTTLDYLRPLNPILQLKFPHRDPETTPRVYTYNVETANVVGIIK